MNSAYDFFAALARIQDVVGARAQEDIGSKLGIRQSSVSYSIRNRNLPNNWLMTLVRKYHVNPDWIIFGEPHKPFLVPSEEAPYGSCKASRLVRAKRALGSASEVSRMRKIPMQRLVRGKPPRAGGIRQHRKNSNRSQEKENQYGDFQKD